MSKTTEEYRHWFCPCTSPTEEGAAALRERATDRLRSKYGTPYMWFDVFVVRSGNVDWRSHRLTREYGTHPDGRAFAGNLSLDISGYVVRMATQFQMTGDNGEEEHAEVLENKKTSRENFSGMRLMMSLAMDWEADL